LVPDPADLAVELDRLEFNAGLFEARHCGHPRRSRADDEHRQLRIGSRERLGISRLSEPQLEVARAMPPLDRKAASILL